jgi:hypothetical protein
MNVKLVDIPRFAAYFFVLGSHNSRHTIDFHNTDPILNFKVLGLELVEVHGRAFGASRGIDERAEVVRNGSFNVVPVGLAHGKRASGLWFAEFGGEQATKPIDTRFRLVVRRRAFAGYNLLPNLGLACRVVEWDDGGGSEESRHFGVCSRCSIRSSSIGEVANAKDVNTRSVISGAALAPELHISVILHY